MTDIGEILILSFIILVVDNLSLAIMLYLYSMDFLYLLLTK